MRAIGTTELVEEVKQEHVEGRGADVSGIGFELLLNAVKNRRRMKLAKILTEGPLRLSEIQRRLKREGFYHSQDTIRRHYAGPMVAAKLLVEADGAYGLTDEGRGVVGILGDTDFEGSFPASSKCYEEACLLALEAPRSYGELSKYVPKADLQRTIRRLQAKGLVTKAHPDRHVTYRRSGDETAEKLTKTESRMLASIPRDGIGVSEIANAVGISMRRTFKYLRRLREKGLVSANADVTLLSLTEGGNVLAGKLRRIIGIVPLVHIQEKLPTDNVRGDGQKKQANKQVNKTPSVASEDLKRPSPTTPRTVAVERPERRGRFTTKRDIRERELYDLILRANDGGIVQSTAGAQLGLPSREISRICGRLESWGLIMREGITSDGKRTFRIRSTRRPPSFESILGAPCITCPNVKRCERGNGSSSPQECESLEKWIMDSDLATRADAAPDITPSHQGESLANAGPQ